MAPDHRGHRLISTIACSQPRDMTPGEKSGLAPGARVVKALNNMTVPNLEADPVVNGARRVAFISADDDGAKKRVETLLKAFGYCVIDLGNLRDGGLIQQAGGPLAGRDLLERGE